MHFANNQTILFDNARNAGNASAAPVPSLLNIVVAAVYRQWHTAFVIVNNAQPRDKCRRICDVTNIHRQYSGDVTIVLVMRCCAVGA